METFATVQINFNHRLIRMTDRPICSDRWHNDQHVDTHVIKTRVIHNSNWQFVRAINWDVSISIRWRIGWKNLDLSQWAFIVQSTFIVIVSVWIVFKRLSFDWSLIFYWIDLFYEKSFVSILFETVCICERLLLSSQFLEINLRSTHRLRFTLLSFS